MDARKSVGKPLTREKNKMCQNALTMREIHWLRVTVERKDGKLHVEGKYSRRLKTVRKEH